MHRELDRKGMTLMLLWQEYVAAHPAERTWRYTQFCEHYKAFAQRLKRSMHQHRRAGEKLFVDFAGPTLTLADGSRAHVFVAAMGASSYVFACATKESAEVGMPDSFGHNHVQPQSLTIKYLYINRLRNRPPFDNGGKWKIWDKNT